MQVSATDESQSRLLTRYIRTRPCLSMRNDSGTALMPPQVAAMAPMLPSSDGGSSRTWNGEPLGRTFFTSSHDLSEARVTTRKSSWARSRVIAVSDGFSDLQTL